jgi:iron complex outermembrane recepter protein
MDYTNLQVQTPIGAGVFDIRNAAEATVSGIELETRAELGDGVQSGAYLTWLDARYDQYIAVNNNNVPGNVAGNRLNNAPELSGRGWIEWSGTVPPSRRLTVAVEASTQSTVFFTPFNDDIQRQPAYALLGAHVEYGPRDRRWSVQLFGKNLLNTAYIMAAFGTSPAAFGGRPGAPREFGASLVLQR